MAESVDFEACPLYRGVKADVCNLSKKIAAIDAHDVQPLKVQMTTKVSTTLFLSAIVIITGVLASIGAMNWAVKDSIMNMEKSIAVVQGSHEMAQASHEMVRDCLEKLTDNVTRLTIHQEIRLAREKEFQEKGRFQREK